MPVLLRERVMQAQSLPNSQEVLLQRAELLAPRDRELIEAVFLHGQSASGLARLMGQEARTVQNRVHRLAKRLVSRDFLRAARSLHHLDKEQVVVARKYFCEGLTIRELARELDITLHEARRRLYGVRAAIDTVQRVQAQIAAVRRRQTRPDPV
jgi:DNA-directed RNA polymerase specialized sigma24 family protein